MTYSNRLNLNLNSHTIQIQLKQQSSSTSSTYYYLPYNIIAAVSHVHYNVIGVNVIYKMIESFYMTCSVYNYH